VPLACARLSLCRHAPPPSRHAAGAIALSGRDLPDGNFKELEASGAKQKSSSGIVLKARRAASPLPMPHPAPVFCSLRGRSASLQPV